jgi:hypothetical protein
MTEAMEIEKELLGYTTYEFTTSPIHAKLYPEAAKEHSNPRRKEAVAGKMNYLVIETETENDWVIRVRAYGPGNERLYTVKSTIKRQ